ncbi:MAG: hypothetical protein SGI87_11825, partial [Flavobacteriales bacterium]|nr:hypothetical protein [Flavobacteriales bacterium]
MANAQLVDVINEVHSTGAGVATYPAGHTTYRIYARLQDSNDFFSACYGISDPGQVHLLRIGDTEEAGVNATTLWNSAFGGVTGSEINPAFCGIFPETCFDSFVTIGRASNADPGNMINVLTNPAGQIVPSFGTAAGPAAPAAMINDGAWFSLNGDVNGLPVGPQKRVLLAQVTCPTGTLAYQLNLQIFDAGIGNNQVLYAHTFTGDPVGFVGPYPEIDGTCLGLVFPEPGVCNQVVAGCIDQTACNFNPDATEDDGSCDFSCYGCTQPTACNFDPAATLDDGSCDFVSCLGCTDPTACNYESTATQNDGSCTFPGCTNPNSLNYDANAGCDDGSCIVIVNGCTSAAACNYNPAANVDNGSCTFPGCTNPNSLN